MASLGERIKSRRNQLNITQAELAEMLDTDQKQISKYETDKQNPSADVIARISIRLNTTTDWLLGLTENVDRPIRDEKDLNQKEKNIIMAYRQGDFKRLMKLVGEANGDETEKEFAQTT